MACAPPCTMPTAMAMSQKCQFCVISIEPRAISVYQNSAIITARLLPSFSARCAKITANGTPTNCVTSIAPTMWFCEMPSPAPNTAAMRMIVPMPSLYSQNDTMKRRASGYCFSSFQLCARACSVCDRPTGAEPLTGGSGTHSDSGTAAAAHHTATSRNEHFTPVSPNFEIRTIPIASSTPAPR